MTTRKQCSCGHLNDPDRLYCENCGASLISAPEVEDEELLEGGGDSASAEPDGTHEEQNETPELNPSYECECIEAQPDAGGRQCRLCGGAITRHEEPKQANPAAADPSPSIPASHPVARISGQTFDLSDGLLIGRYTDCRALRPLLIGHSAVSRYHVWLMAVDERLLILDLKSHNGTWINGRQLKPFEVLSVSTDKLPIQLYAGASLSIDIVMEEIL